jgi:hypothetical protein
VIAPLATYSLTLAAFGAAHVLSELRYVDRRFGRSLGGARLTAMAVFLAGAVLARSLGVFGVVPVAVAVAAELACVTALVLSAAIGGSASRRALAVAAATALGFATLVSPFDTAVTLSLLHNFTPLVFLWEIAPRARRGRIMALAALAFIGLPLLVATGLPRRLLAALTAMDLDPIGAGGLADHLYVYVPRPLLASDAAIDLFSAAVVAQCAHYAAVILVLPALLAALAPGAKGIVPWPRGAVFAAGLVLCAACVFLVFAHDFVEARALYGIAASVHAWIELPLVVIALTAPRHDSSAKPMPAEATLARADNSSARRADRPAPQA